MRKLPAGAAELLKGVVQFEELPDEEVIFREGDPSEGIFLILDGTVVFSRSGEVGSSETEINRAGPGDTFGEIGLLTGERRSLTARAGGPVRIALIPEEVLTDRIKTDGGPTGALLVSVIQHLKNTTAHYIAETEKQEKLALIGGMMSSVLHDLRNPFAVIRIAAQLAEMNKVDPDKVQEYGLTIMKQVDRAEALIQDIITFARGEQTMQMEWVSFSQLEEDLRLHGAHLFDVDGVEVELVVGEGKLWGDRERLQRVLLNLLDNAVGAVRATSSGGRIQVRARVEGEQALLEVEDNGPGIPVEIRARIFEPFVTIGKKNGTGLGTAIVKSIVDAHGGTIEVQSEEGRGSCFSIRIPLGEQAK